MIAKLRKLLAARPFYRYVLVGGSVYVLELGVIVLASSLGAGPVLAVAISYGVGLAMSFILQKVVTFGDKRLHHRILVPQAVVYTLLVLFNLGFTLGVTVLLAGIWPVTAIRTGAIAVTTLWNFYLYKTRIFKPTPEENIVY